ncbi:MAG: hypothetical protein GY953_53865, partial [bacterium]|nr:hypothetical protein [bacterium]
GIFTWSQDGSRRGIFTRPDFSLVSPASPAKPGDVVIGWGLGFGGSPFVSQPGAFDKRGQYADYEIRVNDVVVPKESISYIGSAGGFAGGDQFAFAITQEMARGCANTITITLYDAEDQQTPILANPVDLPISPDGSACGDPHGLPSDAIATMANAPVWLLTATAGDFTAFDDTSVNDLFLVNVRGDEFLQASYFAPTPYNTCTYRWEPLGSADPFAPRQLVLNGAYTLALPGDPGAVIGLSAFANGFSAFFNPPAEGQLADGQYTVSSQNFGLDFLAFNANWTGNYTRVANTVKDRFEQELGDSYAQDAILTWDEFVEAAQRVGESADFPADPRVIQLLTYLINDGPRGVHRITCRADWQAAPAAEVASMLRQSSQRLRDAP